MPWVPQVRGVSWVQVPSVPGALRLASCLCAALGALPKISHGTSPAPPNRVPYDHKELVVWQLADQLRIAVFALTENGAAARDFKYRDQIRDAVSSIARNLAEGFYRYEHPDFANFTRYARASLGETQDLLHEGRKRRYWNEAQTRQADSLARRLMIGVRRLHRYLRTTTAPSTHAPRRKRR